MYFDCNHNIDCYKEKTTFTCSIKIPCDLNVSGAVRYVKLDDSYYLEMGEWKNTNLMRKSNTSHQQQMKTIPIFETDACI